LPTLARDREHGVVDAVDDRGRVQDVPEALGDLFADGPDFG
jgi:hypothetical protein